MKRFRKFARPILLAYLLFSCTGCGDSDQSIKETEATPQLSGDVSEGTTDTTPVFSFPSGPEETGVNTKLGRIYQTMEELFEAADSIIIGEVCHQEFYQHEENRNSYTQIWIEETLYGNQLPQKMLTVCELGAKYGNGSEGSLHHVPLLRKGQRVLLFLFENTLLPYPWHNGCAIVGNYQGKFFYNQEENAWYHSGLLGGTGIVPDDARDPLSDADMRERIKEMSAR